MVGAYGAAAAATRSATARPVHMSFMLSSSFPGMCLGHEPRLNEATDPSALFYVNKGFCQPVLGITLRAAVLCSSVKS